MKTNTTSSPRETRNCLTGIPALVSAFRISLFAFVAASAHAATPNWSTAVDGNWTDTSNWSTAAMPVAGDTVTFNAAGQNGNETISLNGNQSALNVTIANTGTTTFLGGTSGTPVNQTLTLGSGASGGSLLISAGSGNVTFGDVAGNAKADLVAANTSAGYVISNQSTVGTLTFNSGLLNASGAFRSFELRGATTGTSTTIFNGVLANNSGAGNLAIRVNNSSAGNGTFTFNAANTYTGGFQVDTVAGQTTLNLGNDAALGAGAVAIQGANSSSTITIQSTNGPRTLGNNIAFSAAGTPTFGGSYPITLGGNFTASAGRTLYSSITNGGVLTLSGNVYLNNADTATTLTLAGTGNTRISGAITNNSGNNTVASGLTITNTGTTTLAGANTFTGALKLDSNSTVKLANASAVASASGIAMNAAATDNTTLWLASDAPVSNLKLDYNSAASAKNHRIIFDAGTVGGYGGNQTITSLNLGQQQGFTFQKGSFASATPAVTVAGTTVYGNNNSGKVSVLNARDVNVSLAAAAAAGNGTAGINSAFVLDGNTANSVVTGVIGNGSSATNLTPTVQTINGSNNVGVTSLTSLVTGMALTATGTPSGNVITATNAGATPTSTAGSNATLTVNSATGIAVGSIVTGTNIQAGTYVSAVSGTTITINQAPSGAVSGNTTVFSPSLVMAQSANATNSGASTIPVANVTNLIKSGPGTWTLNAANTYTGFTAVNGGTLNLDFNAAGAPTSDILYNGFVTSGTGSRPTVTIAGGTLKLSGSSTANVTQSLSALSMGTNGNSSKVVLAPAPGQNVSLTMTSLTLSNSQFGLIDFSNTAGALSATGSTINNSAASGTAGFVGQNVTVNGGTDFAYYDAGKNIVTPASGNYTTFSAGANIAAFYSLSGNLTRNSAINVGFFGLKIANASNSNSLDLNTGFLTTPSTNIKASTILYTGGFDNQYTIKNGTIRSYNASGVAAEMVLSSVSGSNLTIASDVNMIDGFTAGALSLTKAGAGAVTIVGAKAFSGKTNITEGTLSIDTLANGGTISGLGNSTNVAGNLIISGGTLKYTGSTTATDRSFSIGSKGATLDASGTGPITWAPAAALPLLNNTNSASTSASQSQSIAFTGTNTGANTFGSALGLLVDGGPGTLSVTKSGSGTWLLAGANTYTGGTYINGGTLGVTGTETAGTSGPLGKTGPIVFAGGTLQYSATNTADYSKRILLGTSAVKIDTNGQNVTYASAIDSSNTGGLTLSDTNGSPGSLTLTAANTFSGPTTVTSGTLIVSGGGSLNSTSNIAVLTGATLTNNTTAALTPALLLAEGSNLTGSGSFTPSALTLVADLLGGSFTPVTLGSAFAQAGALSFTLTNVTDGSYPLFTGTSPTGFFTSVSVGGNPLTNQGGGIFSANIGGVDYTFNNSLDTLIVAIPEPATWLLVGIGLTFILYRKPRRRSE